jgi:drug/metabolite transporter (DMT)-like permease
VELWIAITVLAAFLQNARSALQRNLLGRLAPEGATYVRFLYAVPFALLYFAVLTYGSTLPAWRPGATFVAFAVTGGLAQVVATLLLIRTFTIRSFAVGTAYSKTETMQAVLFGLVILGERVDTLALAGILVSGVGVWLLGGAPRVLAAEARRAIVLGLASGASFAVSVVCYRGAALSLETGGYLLQSAFTLVVVVVFQALAMGVYLALRDRAELVATLALWRKAWPVGLTGMGASAAWFAALTLERAAYVRAVGQVELLFTFAVSIAVFRERARSRDVAGAVCIVLGILLLLAVV